MTTHHRPAATGRRPPPPAPVTRLKVATPRVVRGDRWWPVLAFAAFAVTIIAITQVAHAVGEPAVRHIPVPQVRDLPAALSWLGAWTWWDGAWYVDIARRGYTFTAGPQSPVAFFPAYPLAVRAVSAAVGHAALAGFIVTLVAGGAAVVLYHRWVREFLDRRRSAYAMAALLLYPCSFYLAGAVYADALFLVAALGAFLFLERDRPVAAGLAAAVATACRPTGLAVVAGLWLRAWERRRQAARAGGPGANGPGANGPGANGATAALRPPGRRYLGLAMAPAGFLMYAAFLYVRFGDPLAFAAAQKAWGQAPGPQTWFKFVWFERMATDPFFNALHYHLIGSALTTVIALLLVPRVYRRFGLAYAVLAMLLVGGAALSTRDFIGMGRYVLAAFPCFAAAGDLLADSPRLARVVLAASGGLLVFFTQLHARGMLIS